LQSPDKEQQTEREATAEKVEAAAAKLTKTSKKHKHDGNNSLLFLH